VSVATLEYVNELEVVEIQAPATAIVDADRIVIDLELRHGQAMFGFIRRQGITDVDAQDAVQETLLRLWKALRSGVAVDNPRAWAYRTMYRVAMDQHRMRRRLAAIADRLGRGGSDWAGPPSDSDDRRAVWSEVDRLSIRQRQVLYLRYRSDLAFDEIGRVLGISASAARSHATQAMTTLRRNLTPEDLE
jgi:RNA polymerase sigma factor (sigma-70 family)